ncbi:hypothetical protein JX266_008332 [Neoarthrinium moseri]|nr:hypothetical protein JX266_008332 [Neoarthrinium moseri]
MTTELRGEGLRSLVNDHLAVLAIGAVTVYASLRFVYLSYLHPASHFPGPKLAAVSNLWYAYQHLTGRYPWAVMWFALLLTSLFSSLLKRPLVGMPWQSKHIEVQTKNLEHFVKVDVAIGFGDDGITWEKDPAKHRQMAKKLSPSFSVKSLKALEPIMHKHIDKFVQTIKTYGNTDGGIELKKWTDWVAMDMAADMASSRELKQVQDMKSSPLLTIFWAFNFFITVNQVFKKFPLLSPLKWAFLPFSVLFSRSQIERVNRDALEGRIESRTRMQHPDHFEQLLPANAPIPTKREKLHLEILVSQLFLGGYEPVASQIYCAIMFSLHEPGTLKILVKEVRNAFNSYEDISSDPLASLSYLNAVLMESMRLTVNVATGLARSSPGSEVDGNYIAKGITVQYAHFAFTRSSAYFHDPHKYWPQRWLPTTHEHWDPAFQEDATDSFFPFGHGPRACIGQAQAWRQMRLFVAKVLWTFDVEMLPDQDLNFERDFKLYAMWEKPEFWARFHEVAPSARDSQKD